MVKYRSFRADNGKLIRLKKGEIYHTKYGVITYNDLDNSRKRKSRTYKL